MLIRVLKELPDYLLNRIQGAMGREAHRLWVEGIVATEEIELGIKDTFGFRMPHEGSFGHYNLVGIWKSPAGVRTPQRNRQSSEPLDEAIEKVRARMAEEKPWFVDPNKFDQAIKRRNWEYVRRLKEPYSLEDGQYRS